jgi:hypothetical protein
VRIGVEGGRGGEREGNEKGEREGEMGRKG